MGLLDGPKAAGPKDAEVAGRAFDGMMLKQLLAASGAFKGSSTAGASINSDLFVEALADAVTKAGGLGIGKLAFPSQPETPAADAAASPELGSPLPLDRGVTSSFGSRKDPIDGHRATHRGVDLRAPEGTPVLAAAAGTVKRAGVKGGLGEMVELDHGNGLTTIYAHTAALLVREGQHVEQGRPIALVGSSGKSTAAHLHFEVRQEGKAVDPSRALKAYGKRAEESTEGDSPSRGRYP